MPTRYSICLTLSLLFYTVLNAQNTPPKPYQGLLWEISGKGTTHPSYLYGTMHIPEKLAYNLSDSFFVALRSCDLVSLETNHDVWQDFMQKMKEESQDLLQVMGGYGAGGYNNQYIDLYGDLFKFEAPDVRLFEGMFAYKPVMANEFLYRSNGFGEDFEENTYLDLFIFQAGKKLGKTVIGLETMEGSYEAVTRARIPDDKKDTEETRYDRKYVSPNAIRDAYRKQDLRALDSLNILTSPGKNFRKWMLEERNVIMANGIDSVAQSGKSMFSAVGAAHLPGDIGVIEMLRKKGYTVRPVKFSFDTDKKDMAEIDKMRYPVKMATQWSSDSTWTADAPSKFYTTSDYWRIKQDLCADMSNGAYYAVYSIQTFGLWTGQSPEYISSRIDSIIYERVPGKIQERKRITEPFPGHDITTLTRRGDVQRYKIIITPNEILMFLMGGNGDYVSGPEGQQFFNSIRLNPKKYNTPNLPTRIAPVGGRFAVTFPTPPLVNTTADPKSKNTWIASYNNTADSAFYFMTRVQYHDTEFIEEDSFELNIIAEKIAEQFTQKRPNLSNLQLSPYPSQDFSFVADKDNAHYFGRLVIDGPSYYLLGCRKVSAGMPVEFFNSFSIQPGQWPEGWKTHTDTVLHFQVTAPVKKEKPLSQFMTNMKKIGEELVKKSREQYGYEDNYSNIEKEITLESPQTREQVTVKLEQGLLSFFPDRDSLQRAIANSISSYKRREIKSQKMTVQGDSLIVFEFLAVDTNSNRGILTKIYHTNTKAYTLATCINTDAPRSEFITRVFDSFVPQDTSLKHPIQFGKRDLSFFSQIYASDSLVQKKALSDMRKFGWSDLLETDYPMLRDLIKHPKFDQLKYSDKVSLLECVGGTHAKEALPFLDEFYRTHADSARYQNAALSAISNLNSSEAYDYLLTSWENGGYMRESELNQVYYMMRDTVELVHKQTKRFFNLLNYPQHHTNVLMILEKLHEKGFIKPKVYRDHLPLLKSMLNAAIQEDRLLEEDRKDRSNDASEYYGGYEPTYSSLSTPLPPVLTQKLLLPFYDSDPQVRALFDKALKHGNSELKITTITNLLKQGKTVDQSILKSLADKDKTRFDVYKTLFLSDKLAPYSAWFSDTTAMAQSIILQNVEEETIDSVRFVSRHKTVMNKKAAYLYFFEVKRKKSKEWVLNYVTLPKDYGLISPNKNKEKIRPDAPVVSASVYPTSGGYSYFNVETASDLNTEKEKQAFINKKIGEIRFEGRQRYRAPNKYNSDY